MILKIEGTDREIINFVEGVMELTGCDMRVAGCESRTSASDIKRDKMPVFSVENMLQAYEEFGRPFLCRHETQRPGDDLFWELFHAAYLSPSKLSIKDAYHSAWEKTQVRTPGAIIPSFDQVRHHVRKLDRKIVIAARHPELAKKEKAPADKPKPYSGGQNNPQEKKEAEVARKNAGLKTSAPRKVDTSTSHIKKTKAPKVPKTREVTIQEIREEVPLEECTTIPEAIEAILTICKTSGAHLGRLIGLDKSVLSNAKNGKVYPIAHNAFAKYFPELLLKALPIPGTDRPWDCEGALISLDKLLEVDLSDCRDIPAVINKLQLETNISGTCLAKGLGIHASDLSKARKGITPPFVERAFKQHLQFSAKGDTSPSESKK